MMKRHMAGIANLESFIEFWTGKHVDVSHQDLFQKDWNLVIKKINGNSECQHLDLSHNHFSSFPEHVIQAFVNHPSLLSVDISENKGDSQFLIPSGYDNPIKASAVEFDVDLSACVWGGQSNNVLWATETARYRERGLYLAPLATKTKPMLDQALACKQELFTIKKRLHDEWMSWPNNHLRPVGEVLIEKVTRCNSLLAQFDKIKKSNPFLQNSLLNVEFAKELALVTLRIIRHKLKPLDEKLKTLNFQNAATFIAEFKSVLANAKKLSASAWGVESLFIKLQLSYYSQLFKELPVITQENYQIVRQYLEEARTFNHPNVAEFLDLFAAKIFEPFQQRLLQDEQRRQQAEQRGNEHSADVNYLGLFREMSANPITEWAMRTSTSQNTLGFLKKIYSGVFSRATISLDNFDELLMLAHRASAIKHEDAPIFYYKCYCGYLNEMAELRRKELHGQLLPFAQLQKFLQRYADIKVSIIFDPITRNNLLSNCYELFSVVMLDSKFIFNGKESTSSSLPDYQFYEQLRQFHFDAQAYYKGKVPNTDICVLSVQTVVAQLYGEILEHVAVYKQEHPLRASLLDDVIKLRAELVAAGTDPVKLLEFVQRIIKCTLTVPLMTPPLHVQDAQQLSTNLKDIIEQQKMHAPAAVAATTGPAVAATTGPAAATTTGPAAATTTGPAAMAGSITLTTLRTSAIQPAAASPTTVAPHAAYFTPAAALPSVFALASALAPKSATSNVPASTSVPAASAKLPVSPESAYSYRHHSDFLAPVAPRGPIN